MSEPLKLEPEGSIITKAEAAVMRPGDKILLVWTHPAYLDLKAIEQIHKAAQATEKRARKDGIALHVIVHPEGFDVKAYRLAP